MTDVPGTVGDDGYLSGGGSDELDGDAGDGVYLISGWTGEGTMAEEVGDDSIRFSATDAWDIEWDLDGCGDGCCPRPGYHRSKRPGDRV